MSGQMDYERRNRTIPPSASGRIPLPGVGSRGITNAQYGKIRGLCDELGIDPLPVHSRQTAFLYIRDLIERVERMNSSTEHRDSPAEDRSLER